MFLLSLFLSLLCFTLTFGEDKKAQNQYGFVNSTSKIDKEVLGCLIQTGYKCSDEYDHIWELQRNNESSSKVCCYTEIFYKCFLKLAEDKCVKGVAEKIKDMQKSEPCPELDGTECSGPIVTASALALITTFIAVRITS